MFWEFLQPCPMFLTTKPYYRSTYVFVSRRDRNLQITSLLDDRLSHLRIGIHVVGDDYAPPAFALAHRGITQNVVGFSLFGEYGEANPPRKLIRGSGIAAKLMWRSSGARSRATSQNARKRLSILRL